MKEETLKQHISQAKHFIRTRLGTDNPHVQELRQALIDHAFDDDSPGQNSWNKKRRSLELYYIDRCITDEASFIKATKFPKGALRNKPDSCMKKVSDKDLMALLHGCKQKKQPDLNLFGALVVAYMTGCRPSEMMTIELLPDNAIFIEGAKKTEDGERGIDRVILLEKKQYQLISLAIKNMKRELDKLKPQQSELDAVEMLQKRLDRLYKKLFPKRKKHITFKSFRHQLGSELKSSGLPRTECAAILGHQSVNSINPYGDSRSGKGRVMPRAHPASIKDVRVTAVKNADYKETLVRKHVRKPDKITSSKPVYQKTKIGGSTAYLL